MPSRATLLAALVGAATVATAALIWTVRWFNDDQAEAAERYRHMIGADLAPEERLERARRLAVGAPVYRVRRDRSGGLFLERT